MFCPSSLPGLFCVWVIDLLFNGDRRLGSDKVNRLSTMGKAIYFVIFN